MLKNGADVDQVLAEHTAKLRPNHYAALVTKVGRRSAKYTLRGGRQLSRFNWHSGPIHRGALMGSALHHCVIFEMPCQKMIL